MDGNNAFSNFPAFTYGAIPMAERRAKWYSWKRGFEICLRASKITEPDEKKDLLLAKGGFELQEIFFNIPGADVPTDKEQNINSYTVAIEKLDGYFAPQRHEAHERYLFWGMKPEPDENLEKFLMRAQMQASKCNFGKTAMESSGIAVIDKILQFVPAHLREKLLLESELSVEKVVQQINAFETTRSASEQISGQSILQQSDKIPENVSRILPSCKFCGRSHASDGACPAWNKTCSNCGKRGHFRAVCFSRSSSNRYTAPLQTAKPVKRPFGQTVSSSSGLGTGPPAKFFNPPQKRQPGRLHAIEDEDCNEDNAELIEMVSSANDSGDVLCAKVGGILIEMQIDSGAQSNIIDNLTWTAMLQNGVNTIGPIKRPDKKFKAYAQTECLQVPAMFDAEIVVSDQISAPITDYRDKDQLAKDKGKMLEDQRRRAKVSTLESGDKVLMKNVLPGNKLAPTFGPNTMTVTEKHGSRVTVRNDETLKRYDRNASHLKKIVTPDEGEGMQSEPIEKDNLQRNDALESAVQCPGTPVSDQPVPAEEKTLERALERNRPQRSIRKPLRFEDCVLDY
nr:uncharacterized protein LOC115256727 [Aedes albopictus]